MLPDSLLAVTWWLFVLVHPHSWLCDIPYTQAPISGKAAIGLSVAFVVIGVAYYKTLPQDGSLGTSAYVRSIDQRLQLLDCAHAP